MIKSNSTLNTCKTVNCVTDKLPALVKDSCDRNGKLSNGSEESENFLRSLPIRTLESAFLESAANMSFTF